MHTNVVYIQEFLNRRKPIKQIGRTTFYSESKENILIRQERLRKAIIRLKNVMKELEND